MQLFRSQLFYCSDPFYPVGRSLDEDLCAAGATCAPPRGYDDGCDAYAVAGGSEDAGLAHVRKHSHHFDAFGPALASTLRLLSFDDWHVVALSVLNASPRLFRNLEPQRHLGAVVFFVIFGMAALLVGVLFIGVIYGTFSYATVVREAPRGLHGVVDATWASGPHKSASIVLQLEFLAIERVRKSIHLART